MKVSIDTNQIIARLARFLRSKHFFIAIIVLYLLQAIFFSLAINTGDIYKGQYGVAPDEARHFGNVMYFSKQPVLHGPFVANMRDEDLVLGTVTTFPSNTFYYLMAIPVKVAAHLHFSEPQIYLMLRLLTVLIGAIGLLIFRKLILEVMNSKVIANTSTLALASTGMYVWESAAISYDIPSLVLMFLLMLYLTRLVRTGMLLPNSFYALAILFGVGLIKYTYIPFAGTFVLIAAVLYLQKFGPKVGVYDQKWIKSSRNKLKLSVISLGIILVAVLFIATIGRNLAQYHAVNPDCMRSVEVCNKFEIYWRNHKQAALYDDLVASGQIQPYRYTFFGHIGTWLDTYFISTYTYRGHVKDIKPMSYTMTAVLIAFSISVLFMLAKLKNHLSLRMKSEQRLLLLAALLYVFVVYVFNVKTLYDFGTSYAYQGRYILFTVAILYAFLMLLIKRFIQEQALSGVRQGLDFRLAVISIGIVALLIFNPTVSFFLHVGSPEWFTDVAKKAIPQRLQQ